MKGKLYLPVRFQSVPDSAYFGHGLAIRELSRAFVGRVRLGDEGAEIDVEVYCGFLLHSQEVLDNIICFLPVPAHGKAQHEVKFCEFLPSLFCFFQDGYHPVCGNFFVDAPLAV